MDKHYIIGITYTANREVKDEDFNLRGHSFQLDVDLKENLHAGPHSQESKHEWDEKKPVIKDRQRLSKSLLSVTEIVFAFL